MPPARRRAIYSGLRTATEPKTVVFVSCAGSRDKSMGMPYCSNFCCMYIAKQAILTKDHIPDSQSYVFYTDIRATGKGYDEFTRRAQEDYGASYIRGRVSRIYPKGKKMVVKGADTLLGTQVEVEADLVVLATAAVAAPGARAARREAPYLLRYERLLRGEPSEAPARGDEHGGRLSRGRGPGTEGHPRFRGPGKRGRGKGPLPALEGHARVGPGHRAGQHRTPAWAA